MISSSSLAHPIVEEHLENVLRTLTSTNAPRLLDWLGPDLTGRRIRLTHANKRIARIERMSEFFDANGVGSRSLQMLRDAAEELLTNAFHAAGGQEISFIYDFVSSDGTAYKDYAFVELINLDTGSATQIINMRYNGAGNSVVHGLGLPPMVGTVGPSVMMYPDPPEWSPLGGSSGSCWFTGCGYTGWQFESYVIPANKSGNYELRFGVANWDDRAFDTGLAFSALSLDGVAVGLAPEPASWAMVMAGFFAAGSILRRQRQMAVCA